MIRTQLGSLYTRWRSGLRHASVGTGLRVDGKLRVPPIRGRVVVGNDVVVQCRPFVTELKAGHPKAVLTIGDRVHVGYGCMILAERTAVTIGAGTTIGPMARIIDTNYHDVDTMAWDRAPRPIVIGANVQIGAWVIVAKGSEIGDGAVIHAGAVVGGKVRAGAIVAGNPAREGSREALELDADPLVRLRRFLMQDLGLDALPDADEPVPRLERLDSLGRVLLMSGLEDVLGLRISFDVPWQGLSPAALLARGTR